MTLDEMLGPNWRDQVAGYSYHGNVGLDNGGAVPFNVGGQSGFLQRQTSAADGGPGGYVFFTNNGTNNINFDTNGNMMGTYKGNENGITGMDLVRGAATIGAGMGLGAVASAGMAGGGAAVGSGTMDAAAASDAGGGSLGGSIGASNTAPGLATTTGSGLNPAFDTLGNPADAGISGSPFTPATTQAPLPMTASDAAAASSNSGAALAGPTAGFTPSAAGAGLSALGGGGGTPTFGQAVSGLGSLGQVAGAIQGDNAQKQASNNMLDWLRSQQAKIDGLYQPGSPEYNLLSQQMAAKDAAAGRNSQYGTRAVDMAAKIAQTKAQYTAQLTNGIAGNMSSAFNQNASSNAGLNATIGNLTKTDANGNSQLSNGLSGLSGLSQYF